jgi:hypothetical protein
MVDGNRKLESDQMTFIFLYICFAVLMVCYPLIIGVLDRVENQYVGIFTGQYSIVADLRLYGEHYPKNPEIGDLVAFKAKFCYLTPDHCQPCENCTVTIKTTVDQVDTFLQKNIPLNTTGEMEFYYNSEPTELFIELEGIAGLNYRIPKPEGLERYKMIWNESVFGKIILLFYTIFGILGTIVTFIKTIFILKNKKKREKYLKPLFERIKKKIIT